MEDKEILDKIRGILENNKATDGIKLANIYSIIMERYKYCTKPWYIK